MAEKLLTIDEIRSRLAEGPRRIAAATDGLTPAELRTTPGPDEWSANDVLAHLRACGDVWSGNIVRIISEDHPAWRAMSPRTWMKKTNYPELEFGPSYEAYTAQRGELLAVLKPLSPEVWSRTATVTGMTGDVFERSVYYYAEGLVRHERGHLRQIESIVATVSARQ